jgi:hypothetical protein
MVGERPVAREGGSSDVAQICAPKESTHESEDDPVGEIGLENNLIVVKSAINSKAEAGAAPYCMLMVRMRVCVCDVWCGRNAISFLKLTIKL